MEQHQHNEKCKEVFALLTDYLNLELPVEACRDIEAHIAGCPPCIEFADSLRKTVDLCRQYQPTELPAPIGQQAGVEIESGASTIRALNDLVVLSSAARQFREQVP